MIASLFFIKIPVEVNSFHFVFEFDWVISGIILLCIACIFVHQPTGIDKISKQSQEILDLLKNRK